MLFGIYRELSAASLPKLLWEKTLTPRTKIVRFNPAALLRTTLAGTALLSLGVLTNAQVVGPITTSTPISHLLDLGGAPSDVLTFPKFDGNLGTLLSVAIHLDADISSVITVTNNPDTPSSGDAFLDSEFILEDPLSLLSLSADPSTTNFPYSLAPGDSVTSSALLGSDTANGTFTNALILAEFTSLSGGNIELGVFTNTGLTTTGGASSSSHVTTAGATGTITYNYTPLESVPEPGAWAFLGTSLIGGGFFAIRRRRK
jgi:hypothetical protein